jgi:DNA polymerase-3 subunit epsilon
MEQQPDAVMAEQTSLWTQNELLGLLEPLVSPSPPLVSPPGPASTDPAPETTRREVPSVPAEATPPPVALPTTIPRPESPPMLRHPERLLIIDTETTGLSPDTDQCIEVGAVLFHVPSRSVLSQVSFLLPCEHNAAEAINGIPAEVTRLDHPWQASLACFLAMVAAADALVAHNVNFDRQWFGRGALPPLEKTWICSMEDIHWPPDRQLRPTPSVRDLALAYGVPVWAAHRALTDCVYLAQVFERCPDLEQLLEAACEPRHLYRAQISYADRHLAKQAGFRWNEPVKGAWSRRLSQRELEDLPFAVLPVEENGRGCPTAPGAEPTPPALAWARRGSVQ